MEDRTKKLLLGGAALLGGALCGWYYYEKHHPHPVQRTNSISKSLWMQILKDQEREFYSLFKVIADFSKEYFESMRQFYMMPTHEAIMDALSRDYPEIEKKMAEITMRILEKYGITEEEYSHTLYETIKEDERKKYWTIPFATGLDNALAGFAPKLASDIPDFLTQEKTLKVVKKLSNIEREKLKEDLNAALEKDPSFWSDTVEKSRFFRAIRVNVRLSDEKRETFVEEGLDAFEEAPERILDTAIAKYAEENFEFQQELEYLQRDTVAFDKTFGMSWNFSEPVSDS